MEIALPYGGRLKRFDVRNLMGRFRCHFPEPLAPDRLKAKIIIGLKPYLDLLEGRRILTVINDGYRRTPNDQLLPYIWPLVGDGDFIIATGSHRQPTSMELSSIFGDWLDRVLSRLMIHDCYDQANMVDFGQTSRGTPVKLNKAIARAEAIITINSVEPHFFAGFTGGRKSIIPGLASFETIQANHCLAKDTNATSLILENNPLHQDLEEALDLLGGKPILTLQCIANREGSIVDVFSGRVRQAFGLACKVAQRFYTVEAPQKYDIVIANGEPPLDINLYQLQKAQEHGGLMVREGGILIVMGACPEGTGSDYFIRSAEKYPQPQMALAQVDTDNSFGMHKLIKTARQLEHFQIYYVTMLDAEVVHKVYFKAFDEIEAALTEAYKILGDQAEVAILEDAGYTVPIVKP
jgi:nickel-dependent lactate racemase